MVPVDLADLHVHPALPWAGTLWRRYVQGFRPASLETRGHPHRSPSDAAAPSLRVHGAVFYETYLLRPEAARRRLFRSLESFRGRLEAREGNRLILAAADLDPARLAAGGGEAFFLAVESMRFLRDPADVGRLWDRGVRSLQPIHFLDTRWGGSSREGMLPESRTGLTGLGREMLAEMARLGLILDLAHMSLKNAEECLAAYPGPVMCSHAGFQGIKVNARNVTADLAREIFRRRGLVGVTCWRHLLGQDPSRAKREKGPDPLRAAWTRSYCATVAALAALAPEARVAVGSDRGAPIRAPAWFYTPAHLEEMTACLAGYGWEPARIRGFFRDHALEFLTRSLPA
ncbi:MAG: Peptidase renal dipeptidase [Fibrobacteres bacterium]|nr:Peptidase renal dipeptidase [Fibrobacterota bacterium]